MMDEITQRNNFMRIFVLPDNYPEGFLFGGAPLPLTQTVRWLVCGN